MKTNKIAARHLFPHIGELKRAIQTAKVIKQHFEGLVGKKWWPNQVGQGIEQLQARS